jgi:hypothetical protein
MFCKLQLEQVVKRQLETQAEMVAGQLVGMVATEIVTKNILEFLQVWVALAAAAGEQKLA